MRDDIIVFIFEGERRESELVENVTSIFLKGKYRSISICLPVKQNCYMLWQKIKEDEYATDIIEIVREMVPEAADKLRGIKRQQIDQIFMFFDFDPHQKNLPAGVDPQKVINEMLETFDNETENGKLYISYPMIEAIRDISDVQCKPFYSCYIDSEEIGEYKAKSGDKNPYAQLKKYTTETWRNILNIYCLKISCLFKFETLSYDIYRNEVTPKKIYTKEKQLYDAGKCFVISAIPEFLFDYFHIDFWKKYSKKHNKHMKTCMERYKYN